MALAVSRRAGVAQSSARQQSRACSALRPPCSRARLCARATGSSGGTASGSGSGEGDMVAKLNALMNSDKLTAKELRQLVLDKWGRSYDIRLMRRDSKMYLQVMWKYLEQQSFHLTEVEYMEQLDAVAEFITEWGVAETVRQGITTARPRGPGYTGGTNARCVSIPLDVDLKGARSSEWN